MFNSVKTILIIASRLSRDGVNGVFSIVVCFPFSLFFVLAQQFAPCTISNVWYVQQTAEAGKSLYWCTLMLLLLHRTKIV